MGDADGGGGPIVFGLGEVLWDELPQGRVLGGAPANFAICARELGARAAVVSRVGADDLGDEILERLETRNVDTTLISRDLERPTGTVGVELAADGQPSYEIREGVAWDAVVASPDARRRLEHADALCFGSLAQRDPQAGLALRELVACAPASSLRIFDVNLRQSYYSAEIVAASLGLASALKLNEEELPVVAKLLGLSGGPAECLEALGRRYELKLAALTRGAAGSLLWAEGEVSEHPGVPTSVRDTVGAGDAFTAALAVGWLKGMPLARIQEWAARVAAFVCTCEGATPVLPPEVSWGG